MRIEDETPNVECIDVDRELHPAALSTERNGGWRATVVLILAALAVTTVTVLNAWSLGRLDELADTYNQVATHATKVEAVLDGQVIGAQAELNVGRRSGLSAAALELEIEKATALIGSTNLTAPVEFRGFVEARTAIKDAQKAMMTLESASKSLSAAQAAYAVSAG